MASNLFTSLFNALSDPKSYYALQKEMNLRAVAQTFFNSLAGKTTFDAVILPEDLGSIKTFDGTKAVKVRPIGIYDMIIPEPCVFKDPATIKRILALHPIAYPDSNVSSDGGGIKTPEPQPFDGRVVECFYRTGPQENGKLRGLTYRQKKTNSGGRGINLSCLKSDMAAMGEGAAAFDAGGYTPNPTAQGPTTKGVEDLRSESKYSIPATGPKTMNPKHIVIHYGAGNSALGEQKYGASKSPDTAGYHYAVTRSGKLYYFNDDKKRIIHASNRYFNDNAIAINFENFGFAREGIPAKEDWIKSRSNYDSGSEKLWQPYTEEQYIKGSELLAEICKKYSLDPTGTNEGYPTIVGHDYITAKVPVSKDEPRPLNKVNPEKAKSDPGPAFDMQRIRNLAKSKLPYRVVEESFSVAPEDTGGQGPLQ